ncbi:hypothetical protein O6P43_010202 [Quillaja saponaria]|uniref:Uncharacterized protein n=1 Tax=Quillaja saponaria TaxID=32244 RepID=A0AAD7VDY6_QUISA|nr:hypothetical protein O6P43_010202 [Quillaja saponaria]
MDSSLHLITSVELREFIRSPIHILWNVLYYYFREMANELFNLFQVLDHSDLSCYILTCYLLHHQLENHKKPSIHQASVALAHRRPKIRASYSAALLEAGKSNFIAHSVTWLLGNLRVAPAPLPSLSDYPSTYNNQPSYLGFLVFRSSEFSLENVHSTMKSTNA